MLTQSHINLSTGKKEMAVLYHGTSSLFAQDIIKMVWE